MGEEAGMTTVFNRDDVWSAPLHDRHTALGLSGDDLIGMYRHMVLARTVDQRGIDGAVNGVAELVGSGARSGRRLQSGLVRSYALGVLGGAVLIVAFLVFRP